MYRNCTRPMFGGAQFPVSICFMNSEHGICKSLFEESIAITSGISPAEVGVPYNGELRLTADTHMLEWHHSVDYVQLHDMPLNMVRPDVFLHLLFAAG